MIGVFDRLALPMLRSLDPEFAHGLAIKALRLAPVPRAAADDGRLSVEAFGLRFANPIGIAAGFDKNGAVPDALLRLGFGFAEIGTVTPLPQAGNPRPRLFRLEGDEGVINRLGFNNEGFAAVRRRLAMRAGRDGVVGVNIGANRDATDRIADYVSGIETFAGLASYLTVNVSSPNTPGLRDLQHSAALDELLKRVIEARDRSAEAAGRKPILLKIAPDLSLAELDEVVGVARRRGVDGMIVSNTTIGRPGRLRDRAKAGEQGGLSGRPLFPLSTRILAETYLRVEGAFALVGAGGVDSGAAAFSKIRAGATLIQLYTGLIFRGLGLISAIKSDLANFLRLGRYDKLSDAVGRDVAAWTAEPWPQ